MAHFFYLMVLQHEFPHPLGYKVTIVYNIESLNDRFLDLGVNLIYDFVQFYMLKFIINCNPLVFILHLLVIIRLMFLWL